MNVRNRNVAGSRAHQNGAALVVGLILLLVLTILAVSGMNTSTVELQMAGNMQYAQNAFQAAESGIEIAIRERGEKELARSPKVERTPVSEASPDHYEYEATCDPENGKTLAMGASIGEFALYHYDVRSVGESSRGARAVHTQSYYFQAPDSGPCPD